MATTLWYVSPVGDDGWSGRLPAPNAARTDGPFRTLARAAKVARPGDTCLLRAGVYRETLRPARSGTAEQPIVFRNYEDETPVISGADVLTGWTPESGDIFQAPMDWDLTDQDQLFADGALLTETRWPHNAGTLLQPTRAAAAGGSEHALTDPNLPADITDWSGATLWCAGGDRWICWSEPVTGYHPDTKTLDFTMKNAQHWYTVRPGSSYVLMGARVTLAAPGEWWHDRANHRMLLIPPAGVKLDTAVIEAKRRLHCIDLSGRAFVQVTGLHFRAGGVLTDAETHDCRLARCTGSYVAHSYLQDVAGQSGVIIHGRDNEVDSCELAYSSSSILRVDGQGHRIVNNFIHDGNYGAKWNGAVALAGRKILFSHNTVRHSGRDLVTIHGLMESLIQYNNLSDAGWLTCDLGMLYGHNTDFMNTVIRYNRVHDNRAAGCALGIYFDHCSHNAIVHHNVVYHTADDPIRFNNPSFFNLVFNNSCYATGTLVTFDHTHRDDLYGMRLERNLVNMPITLPAMVAQAENLVSADPGYANPAAGDFTLRPGAVGQGLGAFPPGVAPWRAGHDFAHPPTVAWETPEIDWMNLLRNPCFETGTLEGWTATGDAAIVPGNAWGNTVSGYTSNVATGTSKHELCLTGHASVEQRVAGLRPNVPHTFSGWLRAAAPGAGIRLGVRLADGTLRWSPAVTATAWTRVAIDVIPAADTLTVVVDSTGEGAARCDNLGLPKAARLP